MDRLRAQGGSEAVDTMQLFQSMLKETVEVFRTRDGTAPRLYTKHDPQGRARAATRVTVARLRRYAAISAKSSGNAARPQRQLRAQDRGETPELGWQFQPSRDL